jgi:hypothetical protein
MKDTKDDSGLMPIHYAMFPADFEMLKFLKQCDCSIHGRDDYGRNLLHLAVTEIASLRHTILEHEKCFKDIMSGC